ncbi:hypothetical protein AWU67_04570 [Microterricola viridarii]|uniref:Prohead serine protease domain-containing protein n=1 Tax=Microterricola viridarii TaxID=412690 RepID=A0A0X8E2Q0_9MICO|nr:hypothetical protein AWU67_04570 [Microterricola viridarii]
MIEAGALRPRLPLSRVKLLIDHDQRQPVGFLAELDSDARRAAFSVPEGDEGDKALEQAANGLRDGLSVGINVLDEPGAYMYDENTGTYHVYAAELVEVSLCAIPAYQDAGVTSVAAARATPTPKESNTVTDTLTLEQVEQSLAASVEGIERSLEARLANFTPAASSGPQFATLGAFVQAVAQGDSAAHEFAARLGTTLAYDGSTTADDYKRNAWVADAIALVAQQRKVLSLFGTQPLPAEGMTLEYAKLKSNTVAVGKQAKQGDALVKGKIELKTATTDVETFGGYTEASVQVIKRANTAYLTTMFEAMGIEYARATELAVRAELKRVIDAQKLATDVLELPTAATVYDWLDLLVDGVELYDDRGYTLAGMLTSKDVFKRLMRLEDTNGNSLMHVSGQGVNRVGSIEVPTISGNLASVKFELLPGAEAGTASFYAQKGLTTWEEPGAPFRLQQQSAINLTEAFSLYGSMAVASQYENAIVPITFAAA